jgi:hypothetical protein
VETFHDYNQNDTTVNQNDTTVNQNDTHTDFGTKNQFGRQSKKSGIHCSGIKIAVKTHACKMDGQCIWLCLLGQKAVALACETPSSPFVVKKDSPQRHAKYG